VTRTFSHDGKLVASFFRDGGELKIRIQDLTDQNPIRLIGVGDSTSEPVQIEWSRDGEAIRYLVTRSGEYELWSFSVRTDKHFLIGRLGSEPVEKVLLAPDGKKIATVRGSWFHDAFLVTGLKF
jgi:hypothetical protein